MSFDRINKKNISNLYNYENYDKELFDNFLKENKIVSFSRHPSMVSWNYYLQYGRDIGSKNYNEGLPPYHDHGYAFKNGNKEIYYVYQPYCDADLIRNEIENWAANIGIKCKVYDSTHSWYSHKTCLVILYSESLVEPVI